jgi:hypothetical protein
MNERIQELAEQAWRATSDEVAHLNRIHNRSYSQDEITDIFEIKFAELMVKECVDVCDKIYHDRYPDAEEWERSEEGDAIKQHFGVEE